MLSLLWTQATTNSTLWLHYYQQLLTCPLLSGAGHAKPHAVAAVLPAAADRHRRHGPGVPVLRHGRHPQRARRRRPHVRPAASSGSSCKPCQTPRRVQWVDMMHKCALPRLSGLARSDGNHCSRFPAHAWACWQEGGLVQHSCMLGTSARSFQPRHGISAGHLVAAIWACADAVCMHACRWNTVAPLYTSAMTALHAVRAPLMHACMLWVALLLCIWCRPCLSRYSPSCFWSVRLNADTGMLATIGI